MRLFMAALVTETNTFSPIPTGEQSFAERLLCRGDATRRPATGGNIPLIVWRRRGEADGHEIVESLCGYAAPAGRTLRAAYEGFKAAILEDLRAAMPVDAVLLFMHGAMVAHGYDDCEGDIAAAIRAIVGPGVPIGMELDLHCHLTETMRTACDVIVTYKEYPHVDGAARAEEVYDLTLRTARGEIRPRMAFHDCRMIDMWRTPLEPMKGFVARMTAREGRDGILSVSFGHGFPWGDVADVGARMVVIADGDMAKAERTRRSPRRAGRWCWPRSRTTRAAARRRTAPSCCAVWSSAACATSRSAMSGIRSPCGSAPRRVSARRSTCGWVENAGRCPAIRSISWRRCARCGPTMPRPGLAAAPTRWGSRCG